MRSTPQLAVNVFISYSEKEQIAEHMTATVVSTQKRRKDNLQGLKDEKQGSI